MAAATVLTPGVISPAMPHYNYQIRFRHSSKIGHMKETLEEMAHRPERDAAQERREKKKAKAAASATTTTVAKSVEDYGGEELNFDDLEEDDVELSDGGGEEIEPTLPDAAEVELKMMAYVDRFQEHLKSIRGAEPTPELFDDISVLAYGSPTPLKVVGQVVIVSPTMAQITCFDPSVAKDVQKAIQLSLDQLNPQLEEGGTIKVPLPRVSMEVREQSAKHLKQKAESTKQRIRQVRRKAMDVVKKGKDGKLAGVSKDDAFASAKELEALTETVIERLDKLVDEKMQSIMAV
jgi:ribosome recycling factor